LTSNDCQSLETQVLPIENDSRFSKNTQPAGALEKNGKRLADPGNGKEWKQFSRIFQPSRIWQTPAKD
jgi:hypothetical protein